MRLFLAVELPDSVRLKLAGLCQEWKDNWTEELLRLGAEYPRPSWVRPENLHVTIKFLGEVADEDVPKLCDALATVRSVSPIKLWPDRVDCLPPNGPIRIICAGLVGDLDRFSEVHRQIDEQCQAIGFRPERRKYRPHVTLARLRQWLPSHARKALARASAKRLPAPDFIVSEFVLMQSHLDPQGARYLPVARFPL